MNNKEIGHQKELTAASYLKSQGLEIVEQNFRFHRLGEIDIIASEGTCLVFIEVKYRKTASAGDAAQAVNLKKQIQICKISDYYRMIKKIPSGTSIRFDVIAINGDDIRWIKNAFPYIGKS